MHHLHNDNPLAIETIKVTKERLSYDQLQIKKDIVFPGKYEKLILTLGNKRKYKLHYHDLKLYLKLGLPLKPIHEVLKAFLKPYIQTQFRIAKKSTKRT